jgi:hypothetical protein
MEKNRSELKLILNKGDKITWLRVLRDHSAVARKQLKDPDDRKMAARIQHALDNVLKEAVHTTDRLEQWAYLILPIGFSLINYSCLDCV